MPTTTPTKLHIDLSNGTLDVEGSERFVREIYQEFKERLDGKDEKPKKKAGRPKGSAQKKRPSKASSGSPKTVEDLDLNPKGKPSLKEFYKRHKKLSRNENYLVFSIYLKDVVGVKKVTADHIYTCMQEIGLKAPKTFKQGLSNAKGQTGWFVNRNGDFSYSDAGRKHYEESVKKE